MNLSIDKDHGPPSFKILFVEIGSWSKTAQFTFTVTCMFFFLLIYGFLQEYISITLFNRKLGLFLTLCQFLINSSFAILHRKVNKESIRKIPLRAYLVLALLQASNQAFTNLSMKYLNYPVKTLFKSSRVVPTVLVGVCFMKKKYVFRDYLVVALLTFGLCLFLEADIHTSPAFHPLGVAFILLALTADGATVNLQEYYLRLHDATPDELVAYSYAIGSIFLLFATTIVTDDLYQGIVFIMNNGLHSILAIFVFCFSGYIGVTCATALTKKFGALLSAICTTVRKAVTVFLSYLIFPKPVTLMHCTGGLLFMSALIWKTFSSYQLANRSNKKNNGSKESVVNIENGLGLQMNKGTNFKVDDDFAAVRHRYSIGSSDVANGANKVYSFTQGPLSASRLSYQQKSTPTENLKLPSISSFSSYLPSFPSVTSFPNFSLLSDSRTNRSNPSYVGKHHDNHNFEEEDNSDSLNSSLQSTISNGFEEDKLLEGIEERLDDSQETQVEYV